MHGGSFPHVGQGLMLLGESIFLLDDWGVWSSQSQIVLCGFQCCGSYIGEEANGLAWLFHQPVFEGKKECLRSSLLLSQVSHMRFMQPSRPWLPLVSVLGVPEVKHSCSHGGLATVTKPITEHLGNFHLEV